MSNPLCHFEFMTDDVEGCKQFYAGVFNWEFGETSIPGYQLIRTHRDPSGGIMSRPPEIPSAGFTAYFLVDDIDDTLRRVNEAGGTTVKSATPIPNVGAYAIFKDPEGNVLGLLQPK